MDDMLLTDMLKTTAFPLTNVFDPTNQPRLLYNITCGNSPSDQILYVNKGLTHVTYYEQHDLYGKDFDVFSGDLTNRNQFSQMKDEVRRYGKAEGEMILYDRKNKPFSAKVIVRPVITTDDFDDLIIAYYVIDITRLPDTNPARDLVSIPLTPAIPIISTSPSQLQLLSTGRSPSAVKSAQEPGDENSAKTSAPSFSNSSPSISDLEEESISNPVLSNSDSERTTMDQSSLRNVKRNSSSIEASALEDGKQRLTKHALHELDHRSWEEVNNTKRRKFIDSK